MVDWDWDWNWDQWAGCLWYLGLKGRELTFVEWTGIWGLEKTWRWDWLGWVGIGIEESYYVEYHAGVAVGVEIVSCAIYGVGGDLFDWKFGYLWDGNGEEVEIKYGLRRI